MSTASTIRRIARKEFTELVRDGRFRGAGAIITLLAAASLAAGWQAHREAVIQREEAQQISRRLWVSQPENNPHWAAHYGVHVFKPRAALSYFDEGVDPYIGVSVYLTAHMQNRFLHAPAEDATVVQRFGQLTAAAVLQLLVPLLVVLLMFATFAGEREHGTLRQVMSLGVTRRALTLGKAVGVAVAFAVLLGPAVVIGLVALAVLDAPGGPLQTLPRLSALGAVYLVYFGVFAGVSLAVSARAATSRSALAILLVFWMFTSVLAPRASADVAKHVFRPPSQIDLEYRIRRDMGQGLDGHSSLSSRMAELERHTLDEYQAAEEYGSTVLDKHYGDLWRTFQRQARVRDLVSVFAPMLAIQSVSMGLAGTDLAHQRDFATAAEQYRRDLVKILNDDITYNAANVEYAEYRSDAELWSRVPDFSYAPRSLGWALGNHVASVFVLLLWFGGALAAAFVAVARMSIV
jgi:ABC-2 type transport system permease protein